MNKDEQAQRIDQEALDWLLKQNDQTDARSESAFRAWLDINPEHEAAYLRWQKDWEALDGISADQLAGLRHGGGDALDVRPRSWGRRLRDIGADFWLGSTPRRLALGGAFSLVLGLAVLGVYGRNLEQPQFVASYQTRVGEQQTVRLPDGSTLILDVQTSVQVSYYPHRRLVELEGGQLLADVQRDPARPFHVVSAKADVQVLGTRFSVRELDSGYAHAAQVAVERGRVQVRQAAAWWRFWPAGQDASQQLTAGERVELDASGKPGAVQSAEQSGVAAWSQGWLHFDNVTLEQALAEFRRYGPLEVTLAGRQLGQLRLSGTFAQADAARFMQTLPKVLPLEVRAQGGAYEVLAVRRL